MSADTDYQNNPVGEKTLKDIVIKTREWIHYLATKWKIIFIAGVVGLTLGYVYASFQKTVYTATLTFALEDEKSGGGLSGALGLASTLGFDLGTSAGGAFTGANLTELMKSRLLVEQTLLTDVTINGKNVTLAELFLQFSGWRTEWQKGKPELNSKIQFPSDLERSKFSLQQDSVLGLIYQKLSKSHLNVSQKDKKISIINIDVSTEDELFSKFFAEILAKKVSDYYVDVKSKKARMNVSILERQTDSVRNKLNEAITGVAVANDNVYNLNPSLNVQRTPSARRQVDVQANTAILTQLVTNLELARVSLRKETPLIQIIDRPILPLQKARLGKIKTLVLGGFIASFVMILFLLVRRIASKFDTL
jgi:hypothetical protein